MKKLIITLICLLFAATSYAETWELAVQPWDKADLPSGHKRAKAGDIVAVKAYPWAWGKMELKNYLIVVVSNLTEEEAESLMTPLWKDDTPGTIETPMEVTGKRKFKIDIDKLKENILPELDKAKLADQSKTIDYQPFKETETIVNIDTLEADVMQNKYDLKWRKGKKAK